MRREIGGVAELVKKKKKERKNFTSGVPLAFRANRTLEEVGGGGGGGVQAEAGGATFQCSRPPAAGT